MTLGTAILVLGIIYFCLVSPGFRMAFACAIISVSLLAAIAVMKHEPSGPPPYDEAQGQDR